MHKRPTQQELEAASGRHERDEYEAKLTKKTTWPNRSERRKQRKLTKKRNYHV